MVEDWKVLRNFIININNKIQELEDSEKNHNFLCCLKKIREDFYNCILENVRSEDRIIRYVKVIGKDIEIEQYRLMITYIKFFNEFSEFIYIGVDLLTGGITLFDEEGINYINKGIMSDDEVIESDYKFLGKLDLIEIIHKIPYNFDATDAISTYLYECKFINEHEDLFLDKLTTRTRKQN